MSLKDAFSGLKNEVGKELETNKKEKKDSKKAKPKTETTEPDSSVEKKRTRKLGKRSDPDFTQAPAFIRKTTYQQVKIKLITDPNFKDYSELVEALLAKWLEDESKVK